MQRPKIKQLYIKYLNNAREDIRTADEASDRSNVVFPTIRIAREVAETARFMSPPELESSLGTNMVLPV